jgi:CheY-like chemotaxis protein/glycine cleavage system H lipoate-binding protein
VEAAPVGARNVQMSEKIKILVVDDELPVCTSLMRSLEGESYAVDMALSAEEALKEEENAPHDIVITDLMMPGLSGIELLRRVKEKRAATMVIMITGYPSIESAVESIKLGAFDYIPKPFTPNELRSLVNRAVETISYKEREGVGPAEEGAASKPVGAFLCIPQNSWAKVDDRQAVRIGIHHAFLRGIAEIQAIELPHKGESRYQGEACVRIFDSSDHVHKVWTPVSGRILAVNQDVVEDFSKLKKDPYDEGWLMELSPTNLEADLRNLVSMGGA